MDCLSIHPCGTMQAAMEAAIHAACMRIRFICPSLHLQERFRMHVESGSSWVARQSRGRGSRNVVQCRSTRCRVVGELLRREQAVGAQDSLVVRSCVGCDYCCACLRHCCRLSCVARRREARPTDKECVWFVKKRVIAPNGDHELREQIHPSCLDAMVEMECLLCDTQMCINFDRKRWRWAQDDVHNHMATCICRTIEILFGWPMVRQKSPLCWCC